MQEYAAREARTVEGTARGLDVELAKRARGTRRGATRTWEWRALGIAEESLPGRWRLTELAAPCSADSSVRPGDQASDGERERERETDGDSPKRAGESWQGVAACASGFEHVECARVDSPGARRVAAELASDGTSAHLGSFAKRSWYSSQRRLTRCDVRAIQVR